MAGTAHKRHVVAGCPTHIQPMMVRFSPNVPARPDEELNAPERVFLGRVGVTGRVGGPAWNVAVSLIVPSMPASVLIRVDTSTSRGARSAWRRTAV